MPSLDAIDAIFDGTWISPFSRAICPRCQQSFRLGWCAVVETIEPDETARGPERHFRRAGGSIEEAPSSRLVKLWRLARIPGLSGPHYADKHARRQCPHCLRPLPEQDTVLLNGGIFLIGLTQTTKTTWATVIGRQAIDHQALKSYGCTAEFIDEEMESYYRQDFYAQIFRRREPFEPNRPLGPEHPEHVYEPWPLVFKLEVARPSRFHRLAPPDSALRRHWASRRLFRPRVRQLNLTLFDTSGEQIPNTHEREQYYPQLNHAVGQIIFVDPVILPGAAPVLTLNHNQTRDVDAAEEAMQQTCRVVDSIARQVRRWRFRRTRRPTVVLLTRSDRLRDLVIDGLRWVESDPDPLSYDRDQAAAESAYLEDFIVAMGGDRLISVLRGFPNHIFQAAAPAGGPPDPVTNKYREIAPVRTLLPILWIVDQLGLIRLGEPRETSYRGPSHHGVSVDRAEPTPTMPAGPTPLEPAPPADYAAAGLTAGRNIGLQPGGDAV